MSGCLSHISMFSLSSSKKQSSNKWHRFKCSTASTRLYCSPFSPRSMGLCCDEWTAKPQHSTVSYSSTVFSPFALFGVFSLVFSGHCRIQWDHLLPILTPCLGGVECFVFFECVSAMFSGNWSCLLRLIWNCQSAAVVKKHYQGARRMLCVLPRSNEVDGLFGGVLILAVLNHCADSVCQSKHLSC